MRSTGISRRARSGSRARASVPSSAANVSLSARSARCSGCRRRRSIRSARPTRIPACGPPSSLSPEKQTRSAPAARLAAGRRLVADRRERPRAEIVDERQARLPSRARRAATASGCSVKPTTRKLDWCTRRMTAVLGADRPLVVGDPRAVGGADLDEPGAGARQHVGDPEAVADLDQLAARDEHLAALGERRQGEHHGRSAVVDDERRLGARDPVQQRGEVILTRAARTRVEVVLEVRVAAADLDDAVERRRRERRPAEIGVDQHAGRVEDAPQRGTGSGGELRQRRLDEVARIPARADLGAGAIERGAGGGEGERARDIGQPRVGEQAVDGRERRGAKARPKCRRGRPADATGAGRTSASSAVSRPWACAPTASTCSASIGSGRMPAAMFVTHEIARQRRPMWRAASTSGTVDIPTRSPPSSTDHPDLRRGLEGRAEPGRVDALRERLAEPGGSLVGERAQRRIVGGAHVREARPQRVVVRPHERRGSLQVEVVRDEHEIARRQALADTAAGVRDDERLRAEPAEHPHPEDDAVGADGPRRGGRAPSSPRAARPRTCPSTSVPECPRAVETGQPGISPYGISTASSTRSANPPRPEPRTTAARGTSAVRSRIVATASSITPSPRRRGRRSGRRRTRPPRPARR